MLVFANLIKQFYFTTLRLLSANQAQDFLILNLSLFWLLSLAQNFLRKPKELSFVNYFWSLTLLSPFSSLTQLIEHSRRPNFTFKWATLILLES